MPSSSVRPRSLLEAVCLSARPSVRRSHAWLVRKPDLVWQILTDFLGGRRTDGRGGDGQPFAFQLQKSTAERHFCADERRGRKTRSLARSLSGFLPPSLLRSLVRSSAAGGALLFGLMRLVGMQISSLSLSFAAYSRTDGRTDQQTVREKDHPSERERAKDQTRFHGKSGRAAFFVFSLRLSLSPSSAIWLILCLRAPFVRRPPLPT